MSIVTRIYARLNQRAADKPPRGFLTKNQIAAREDLSAIRVGELLRQAVRAGLVERRDYRVVTNGRLVRVPHYREIKSPQKPNRKP